MDGYNGGYNRPTNWDDNPLSAPLTRLMAMHDLGKQDQRYIDMLAKREKKRRRTSGK